eukprot:851873_1
MQMMWDSSAFIAILTIIYFQLVSQMNTQYSQIWYDSMSNCDNWTKSGSIEMIECGWKSNSCHNERCVRLQGGEYVKRTTDIASYSSLQLQVSVGTRAMENGDFCDVLFQYDTNGINLLCRINPEDDGARYEYWNTVCDLPSSVGKTEVIIWLENDAEGDGDYCYFDDVYLRGIIETPKPTPKPTPTPTISAPTANPTAKPTTNAPTQNPTSEPTTVPTQDPTAKPTMSPSHNPINNPTNEPRNVSTPVPTKVRSALPTAPIALQTLTALEPTVNELSTSSSELPIVTPMLSRSTKPDLLLIVCVAAGAVSLIFILTAGAYWVWRSQTKIQEIDKHISANISNHNLDAFPGAVQINTSYEDRIGCAMEDDVIRINCNGDVRGNVLAEQLEADQQDEGHDGDNNGATTRGSVMHISDDVVPNDHVTSGNDVNEEQKED